MLERSTGDVRGSSKAGGAKKNKKNAIPGTESRFVCIGNSWLLGSLRPLAGDTGESQETQQGQQGGRRLRHLRNRQVVEDSEAEFGLV